MYLTNKKHQAIGRGISLFLLAFLFGCNSDGIKESPSATPCPLKPMISYKTENSGHSITALGGEANIVADLSKIVKDLADIEVKGNILGRWEKIRRVSNVAYMEYESGQVAYFNQMVGLICGLHESSLDPKKSETEQARLARQVDENIQALFDILLERGKPVEPRDKTSVEKENKPEKPQSAETEPATIVEPIPAVDSLSSLPEEKPQKVRVTVQGKVIDKNHNDVAGAVVIGPDGAEAVTGIDGWFTMESLLLPVNGVTRFRAVKGDSLSGSASLFNIDDANQLVIKIR